jgi:dTDP-glucose 4,6-dehydratase
LKPFSPLPERDLLHILEHTREVWEEARGKRFFITGGTGFFGIWLLESLIYINDALGLGVSATVLSRDTARFALKAPHLANRKDLIFLQGDIRSFDQPQGNFDYLIHAATEASVTLNQVHPDEMLDSIVGGMQRILDFASGAGVSKLLFTSSGAVYGKQPSDLSHLPEDYPGAPDCLNPNSAYAEGKRIAELLGMIYSVNSGYEFKVARCFAFVGPHLPLTSHFAIGNFIGDALNAKPIKIEGDGTTVRSYLYAADLAIWLWKILFVAPSGRAYNVGSEQSRDLATIAHLVSEIVEKKSHVEIAKKTISGCGASRYVPSTDRADAELGLKTWINLRDAIQKTAEWYSNNRPLKYDR